MMPGSQDIPVPGESEWAEYQRLHEIVGDIEQVRSSDGNSVEISSDDPEAESVDQQTCVDVCADFTDWQPKRYYARTWAAAIKKAADEARAFYAREKASWNSK